MRIAAIQHDIAWEEPAVNFPRLAELIAEAADRGGQLIALTEMFSTGFSMATERTAEPFDGPSVEFLTAAADRHDVHVCGSFVAKPPDGALPFNQFVVVGPDGPVQRYGKIHPFSYSGEDSHFAAGEDLVQFELDGLRITPFVCYDLRFADEFWTMGPSTDLFLVVANWPAARRHHWMSLLVARAIENQAFVVGVNRVGEGDGLAYSGDSLIIDPSGETVAAGGDAETILVADIDAATVARTRQDFPFLADRR